MDPFSSGTLTVLILWRHCVIFHSLCEFINASVLLCVKDSVSMESTITSGSYDLSIFSSWVFRVWLWWIQHFGGWLRIPKSRLLSTLYSWSSLTLFPSTERIIFSHECWTRPQSLGIEYVINSFFFIAILQ